MITPKKPKITISEEEVAALNEGMRDPRIPSRMPQKYQEFHRGAIYLPFKLALDTNVAVLKKSADEYTRLPYTAGTGLLLIGFHLSPKKRDFTCDFITTGRVSFPVGGSTEYAKMEFPLSLAFGRIEKFQDWFETFRNVVSLGWSQTVSGSAPQRTHAEKTPETSSEFDPDWGLWA